MASKKLVRDLLLSNRQLHHSFLRSRAPQVAGGRFELLTDGRLCSSREFSVFNEFRKQVKGEANSNSEFQQSVKELNEKVGGIKEDLKSRTKQTTEKLYKQVDGIWAEAESTAKKVSVNVKDKISATKAEVKESLGLGKEGLSSSANYQTNTSSSTCRDDATCGTETAQGSKSSKTNESASYSETVYSKLKSATGSVSVAIQKIKDTKVLDFAKKGYNVVKDELSGNPSKKRHMQEASASVSNGERSTRTDIVVLPSKQSHLGKKWEKFKEKMRAHPVFKRISGISEPVVTKSQELAEDIREHWETSDHPVVHKIQDINETVFGETATALSFKEIRRRDPSFSLPEFVAEVQEMIRPTLNAYLKGDIEKLKKHCSPEVIERCKGERMAYESQGFFFENKILHISEVDVRETKMMGSTPIIIVAFQTQQIYCVRDREGSITDGGKDSIQTVYYAWAMQLQEAEELGEGAFYPTWRLREMQQIGVQALI